MNLTKANLSQLLFLARFTPYREAALHELEVRENEFSHISNKRRTNNSER